MRQQVAPGFIDLHSHAAMTIAGQKYQARDGVTTALELEAGLFPVDQSLALLKDRAFINYGVSVGYLSVRGAVKGSFSKGFSESVNDEEMDNVLKLLEDGLNNGGIGIGLPLDYISSVVSESELLKGFELAAKKEVPIFIHMRRGATPGDVTGLEEVVQLGLQTSASIHICHINSNVLSGIEDFLTIVRKARSDGLDVTVEAYPYTADSTQFSEGIPHVLVGGRFVVKDNALVEGSIHGQAVLSEVR